MQLQQKVAIITGASRGIGREIARKLAQQKVKLVLVARSLPDLQDLALQIKQSRGEAVGIQADVTDEQAVQSVINFALAEFGRIDILINNAGIGLFKPAEHIQVSEWDRMMAVNVKGSFLLSKGVIPHMRARNQGHIITIASHASRNTFEQGGVYCASKYAQNAFTSVLRKEVRKYGIKVSSIYPGVVDTYFNNAEWTDSKRAEWLKPQDVADAVDYVLKAPRHVVVDELVLNPLSQVY